MGLGRWLCGLEQLLLLQGTWVQVPAPQDGSRLSVTLVPGHLEPSSDLCESVCSTQTDMQARSKFILTKKRKNKTQEISQKVKEE